MSWLDTHSLQHGTKPSCYSDQVGDQINKIFIKLTETFGDPTNADKIDRALEVMKLIAPLSNDNIAQKSYNLFHVVMQAHVSPEYSQEKKWNASRLTIHGAYKRNQPFPLDDDPQDLLTFLAHHFDLAIGRGENQDEPIHDALCVLAYVSDPATIKALNDIILKKPSLIRGICYVYQNSKPLKLRRAALFFLPLVADRFFNTTQPIMEPDQMKNLCVDWASTVDDFEHLELTPDVQKAALTVLFGMINSPRWRPHIVTEKWKLLECFTLVPDDSQPLRRCIDNPDLIEVIKDVDYPDASVLWLKILWLKYNELTPRVRGQLETTTKEMAQGRRRADLEKYSEAIDSELKKAKEAPTQNKDADVRQTKIDNLQAAKHALVGLKRG